MLDWVGLGWVGWDWVGLGWIGLGWIGLGWIGLGCIGLGCEESIELISLRDPRRGNSRLDQCLLSILRAYLRYFKPEGGKPICIRPRLALVPTSAEASIEAYV